MPRSESNGMEAISTKQIPVLGRQSGAESTFPLLCFHMPILAARRNTMGSGWKEASCVVVVAAEEASSSLHVYSTCTVQYLLLTGFIDVRVPFIERTRQGDDERVRKRKTKARRSTFVERAYLGELELVCHVINPPTQILVLLNSKHFVVPCSRDRRDISSSSINHFLYHSSCSHTGTPNTHLTNSPEPLSLSFLPKLPHRTPHLTNP
jgi:hypothetical protein